MAKLPSGVLVAVEGIDGAGKTTQVALLEARLLRAGFEVVRTKEPTGGTFGRRLRASAVEGRLPPEDELETFIQDRREHVAHKIRPALDAGRIVLIDRYYFSTAAYQGALGFSAEEILARNEQFAPIPDLLVILRIPAAVALARIIARGETVTAFEREEYLSRCAGVFDRIERPFLLKLDGERRIDELHAEILRAVDRGPLFRALCHKPYLQECEPEYCSFRFLGHCNYPGLDLREPGLDPATTEWLSNLARDPNTPPEEKIAAAKRVLCPRPT